MSSESEDMTVSTDSPSIDEVSTERNKTLKKGPWTSAEDAILMEYVNKHGEGNWNTVQKHSGLSRCGKSCRLRWANHLRPDLKKGAFTPEEERRIVELQYKMGNKWARMAAELPGRTDNEIKNFWNTRTKRRQRAGLSIYPLDIRSKDDTETQNTVTFDASNAEILSDDTLQLPDAKFKKLELNQEIYVPHILNLPGSSFPDLPGGSLIPDGLGSTACDNKFSFPMPKRVKRSDSYPVFDGDPNEYFPTVDQSFEISSSYDQNLNGGGIPSSSCLYSGSHAYFNGNTSSSEPYSWPQKLELPSLQYSTQMGSCNAAPSSPLPSLESVDTLIQKSILIGQKISDRDSGLLDAVLLQSQNLKMSKSNNTSTASVVPRDIPIVSSSQPDDQQAYGGDPMSPLGHSAASVFSEYTPHLSESPLDEHQSVEVISVKHEAEEFDAKRADRKDEKLNHINYSRPDFLLGYNWFGSSSNADNSDKDHCISDQIRALLGDDFVSDFNNHVSGSSPFQGLHFESTGKWDDISEICRGLGNN